MNIGSKEADDGDAGGNVRSMDVARDAVAEGVEKARSAVAQSVDAARERIREAGLPARVKKASSRAGEAARDGYDVAKEKIGHGVERARKDLDQLAGDVNVYVRDNPGRAVLIAAVAGFALGFLLRRRGADRHRYPPVDFPNRGDDAREHDDRRDRRS